MKTKLFLILTILFAILTFAPNTFAQDSPQWQQWHLPEGAKMRLGKGTIMDIAYSPVDTRLAVASSIGIWLYDAQTGEELDLLTGHTGWVTSVVFSPDGKTIAGNTGDNSKGSINLKGSISLWDVDTGELLRTITGDTDRNTRVVFSPNGKTIARGNRDRGSNFSNIRLWDVDTGELLRTITEGTDSVDYYDIAFNPDGKTITGTGGNRRLNLWDVDTGEHLRTIAVHTGWVTSVVFSPDGKTIAGAGSNGMINLWDVDTWQHLRTITEHTYEVTSVVFSPDGKTNRRWQS